MRTPGHAVLNLWILAPLGGAVPVIAGALVPDAPIAALYLWQRYVHHTPEEEIWSVHYQKPFWQNVIHGAHSFPITLAGMVGSLALGSRGGAAFFASMFVHALADIPVHAEDAHRHFLPLSQWRFVSPFSYWDVRHHARVVAALEAALVTAAACFVWPGAGVAGRVALGGIVAWYAHGYWRTFLRGNGQWQPYF